MTKERVLVIDRSEIASHVPEGYSSPSIFLKNWLKFFSLYMDREQAETNERFKQIIPYAVIQCGDSYLLTRRTRRQTESRLHDTYSLGLGGHINPVDQRKGRNIFEAALQRELDEEIKLEQIRWSKLVGVINDNSGEVERVHLGLVYLIMVGSEQFENLEPEKYTAQWLTVDQMKPFVPQMEKWASIVYREVCGGIS